MDRKHRFNSEEQDLGLDARITRRDFLDASLLGAGSVLIPTCTMLVQVGCVGVPAYRSSQSRNSLLLSGPSAFRWL